MTYAIPLYQAYNQPVIPIPSREMQAPGTSLNLAQGQEPPQYAPLQLAWENWTAYSPPAVAIDLGQLCTRPFTQLIMLDVDNSGSSVDVEFLFPDTQTTKTVPAGENVRFQAPTNGVRFIAGCLQKPLATDNTQVIALNYLSAPLDIPKTEFNNAAAFTGLSLTANSTGTTIIAAGTDGVLSALHISVNNPTSGATAGAAGITIEDGGGIVLAEVSVGAPPNSTGPSGPLLQIDNLNLRFHNGVVANVTVGTPALINGFASINAPYRVA